MPGPTPNRRLRAAVVGVGAISEEHLGFLAGSTGADNRCGELVAVCDRSPVAAHHAADRFGVAAETDLASLLDRFTPDVVHICTPPSTHGALSIMALEAGAHVVCEKPAATSLEDLDEILVVAQRCERFFTESHNYRFNDDCLAIDQMIGTGVLGAVREVEVRIGLDIVDPDGRVGDPNLPSPLHDLPAGAIHDFTTHFAHLLLHFSGVRDFDRIAAAWSNHRGGDLFRFDDLDAIVIGEGADGPVHGRLRFDSSASPECFELTVRGTTGYARTDLFQPHLEVFRERPVGRHLTPIANLAIDGLGSIRDSVRNLTSKVMQASPYHGLHRMLGLTYDALARGDSPPVDARAMRDVALLVDRLLDEENRL